MDEMLSVSLRFNINIVHLFLVALIPEHTHQRKEKKIKLFPKEQRRLSNHLAGSPDQTLIFMESKIHQLFQTVSFHIHATVVSLLQLFFTFSQSPCCNIGTFIFLLIKESRVCCGVSRTATFLYPARSRGAPSTMERAKGGGTVKVGIM